MSTVSGVTHPSGSFRVDMEQAPSAVQDLKAALAELEDIRRTAGLMGRVDPGSRDSVSADAAVQIGRAAVGGPGSLVSALDAGIRQVQQLIASMDAEMVQYREDDARMAEGFSNAPPS